MHAVYCQRPYHGSQDHQDIERVEYYHQGIILRSCVYLGCTGGALVLIKYLLACSRCKQLMIDDDVIR